MRANELELILVGTTRRSCELRVGSGCGRIEEGWVGGTGGGGKLSNINVLVALFSLFFSFFRASETVIRCVARSKWQVSSMPTNVSIPHVHMDSRFQSSCFSMKGTENYWKLLKLTALKYADSDRKMVKEIERYWKLTMYTTRFTLLFNCFALSGCLYWHTKPATWGSTIIIYALWFSWRDKTVSIQQKNEI